jgi:hypothetical protein
MKLKMIKISTGVDRSVMGNVSKFITKSDNSLRSGLGIHKKKRRK